MGVRTSWGTALGALLLVPLVVVPLGLLDADPGDSPRSQSAAPSGQAMPSGDLAGWRQAFADDFEGSELDGASWGRYAGEPGSDPGTRWRRSRVSVDDGLLRLTTQREGKGFTSGGVNNARALAATAGRYEVRMRADRARGVNVVALLWPEDNSWPPEIDFVEDRDGDRTTFAAALHYRERGEHRQMTDDQTVDMTHWHTYGVEWGPGRVSYTLDGREWASRTTKHVPEVPMGLAIQANAVTKGTVKAGARTPETSHVEVDWVVGYVAED